MYVIRTNYHNMPMVLCTDGYFTSDITDETIKVFETEIEAEKAMVTLGDDPSYKEVEEWIV